MVKIIIKYTLEDNYYTQIIEKYIEEGSAFVSTYHNSEEEYKQFLKDVEECNRCKFASDEKEILKIKIQNVIEQNFRNYINKVCRNKNWHTASYTTSYIQKHKKIFINNFQAKIVNLIVDKSFNNEVVYYFEDIRKYITI